MQVSDSPRDQTLIDSLNNSISEKTSTQSRDNSFDLKDPQSNTLIRDRKTDLSILPPDEISKDISQSTSIEEIHPRDKLSSNSIQLASLQSNSNVIQFNHPNSSKLVINQNCISYDPITQLNRKEQP